MRLSKMPPRRTALGAQAALIVCLVATRAAAGEPPGLPVPGGTAALLVAAGLEPSRPRATALLDLVRVLYDKPQGFDAATDERRARVLRYLTTPPASPLVDHVPLPLPEAAWRAVLEGQVSATGASPLLNAILADRGASLLYYGLFSMDDETRGYLAATPAVLREICRSDRAAVLALHGRSLHVRGGRVETPGGAGAAALWEAVARVPASRPDAFILQVLGKDEGRLALLYDAVAHLDSGQQAFALGSRLADARQRTDAFEALYASWVRSLRCWHPASWPFLRGVYDPAELLTLTPVRAGGDLGVLGWRRLWERAFSGRDLPAASGELANGDERHTVDPAWLLDEVVVADTSVRRMRAETWLFGQRLFQDAPRAAMEDVLVALRGFATYRALAATLERLGIRDPAVFAAALRQAQRTSAIRCRDRAATAITLFQGAMVLVERARLSRVLDLPTTARLVMSLSRVPMSDRGEYLGAVASWIESDYLPAIAGSARPADADDEAAPNESRVLAAVAGFGAMGHAARQEIDYEGMRYRVDPAAAELVRLRAVRARQGGASVDSVLRLAREAAGQRGSALLRRRADEALASVLRSLAYACSLGDPDGPVLIAGDPSGSHDFGLGLVDRDFRRRSAWAIPIEGRGDRGWQVIGSLLALDVGLGSQAFRPITTDAPPAVPTVNENDRRAFTEAVVLANPYEHTDRDMERIARAIRRGREQVIDLIRVPAMLERVTARLDESRAQAVAWARLHEPDRVVAFFSAGDLLRLGTSEDDPIERLDAWGTSGLSLDGRLCLHFPLSQAQATLSGRRGKGLSAALVPDLQLLVAEALHEQRLPAALTRAVLAAATPHVVDRLALAFEDDWVTMVGDIERIARARMDDYLATVITSGPLVPVSRGEDRAPAS